MSRLSSFGVVVSCVLAAGCAQTPATRGDPSTVAPADKLCWSAQLSLQSLDAIPQALAAPFAAPLNVTVRSPTGDVAQAVMTNCETLLALRPKGYEATSESDLAAMKTEAARCQTLHLLRTTPPASRPPAARFSLDRNALSILPPALGPGPSPGQRARREDATKQGTSWKVLDPEAMMTAAGPESAVVKGADWTTRLEVIARGDFTGDGVTDVLVRTVSYGTEGSWREVRLRMLSQEKDKGIWAIQKELPL